MGKNILVINCGSSSLKFAVFNVENEMCVLKGVAERLNAEGAQLKWSNDRDSGKVELPEQAGHEFALRTISESLLSDLTIDAVGHRVVHGAEKFKSTAIIDEAMLEQVEACNHLAPLHNPANLIGIRVSKQVFGDLPQVGVFDTAFHQSLSKETFLYPVPYELYQDLGVRRYGFHGTSHHYVYEELARRLGKPVEETAMISAHLGNGCSATAIRDGKSLDHSLGFTPSNGLIMGSRSGDVDHGIIFHLVSELGYSLEAVHAMLTRESGLLGLTGYSDFRDIQEGAGRGEAACQLAVEMVAYRIRKYIGAYAAAMNGLDALIFTAGIGEHSALLRQKVCENMDFLRIRLDSHKNDQVGAGAVPIHAAGSGVQVWVVPTNEELEIARQSYRVIKNQS